MPQRIVNLGFTELDLPQLRFEYGLHNPDGFVYAAASVASDLDTKDTGPIEPFGAGIAHLFRTRNVGSPLTVDKVLGIDLTSWIYGEPDEQPDFYTDGDGEALPILGFCALYAELDEDPADVWTRVSEELLPIRTWQENPYFLSPLRMLACAAIAEDPDGGINMPVIAVNPDIVHDTVHDSYPPIMSLLMLKVIDHARNWYGLNGETIIMGSDTPSDEGQIQVEALGFSWDNIQKHFTGNVNDVHAKATALLASVALT